MRKFQLLVFVLSVLLTACTSGPAVRFHRADILFTCPAGWELDTTDVDETSAYSFLSCQRKGFGSSGLFTLSWTQDSLDLAQVLATHKETLKSNIMYRNANLVFLPDDTVTVKGHFGRKSRYKFSLLGVKHEGEVTCLHGNDKTVITMKQQAVEDQQANAAGFAEIENTLAW